MANDNSVLSAIRARRPRRRDRHERPLDRRRRNARHVQPAGHPRVRVSADLLRHADLLRRVKGGVLWSRGVRRALHRVAEPGRQAAVHHRKSGKAWIVEPGRDKCRRVGQCDLGEECVTSPAFQDGRIYLRGKQHIFCLGNDSRLRLRQMQQRQCPNSISPSSTSASSGSAAAARP